jgi:asparagine synthase (glutamine-hydrolysing)
MCGFAGIVHFDPRQPVEVDRLSRMRDVLSHRGPDGAGLYIDGPVGLSHRRLAIVDVSSAGEQPMTNEDGSVWIAFNGEIYNHASLRPALERQGHRYRSRCDTETIVHQYEEDGDRVVEKLHGMFAFAIWDKKKQELLLARDRLGIKPLYYASTGSALVFGSEIKSLFASGCLQAAFNEEVLPEFLSTRFVSGDDTFFKGIRKLLPGHVLTWSKANGIRTRRYWQLPAPSDEPSGIPFDVQARDLRARLEASVESHLMSDVPLGVFLSGGLAFTPQARRRRTLPCNRSLSVSRRQKPTSCHTRAWLPGPLAPSIATSRLRRQTSSRHCRVSSGTRTNRLRSRRACRCISSRSSHAITSRSC